MANVIPQQIFIRNGQLHTEFAEDHKVSSAHIRLLLSQNLGKSFTPIGYLKGASTVFGRYVTSSNQYVFFSSCQFDLYGRPRR